MTGGGTTLHFDILGERMKFSMRLPVGFSFAHYFYRAFSFIRHPTTKFLECLLPGKVVSSDDRRTIKVLRASHSKNALVQQTRAHLALPPGEGPLQRILRDLQTFEGH